MTSLPTHTRFLIARMPDKQTTGFLRAMHATGIQVHPGDDVSCMPSSSPGLSTLMVWLQCPGRVHERWVQDPRVISFREGRPEGP